MRSVGLAVTAALLAACSGGAATPDLSASVGMQAGRADIGGYSLAYQCEGSGSPTVLLEAGYRSSGIGTFGSAIQPVLAATTRVCTYDRAGDGVSDARPADTGRVTSVTQANELHAMLDAIGVGGPFVVVGHSYGGMVARAFAATYPDETVGMVLLDASSEPEIPVYDRLHAGKWIDGTVQPAPNQTIDIHASVQELLDAPALDAMPLVVVTAGVLEDRWLATVPHLEAAAQTRLAALSANSIHILDRGKGHFLPENDPALIEAVTRAVVVAARARSSLSSCATLVESDPSASCLAPGELGRQVVRPG